MFYLIFVFGLVVGSFLNVVIYRLKNPAPQLRGGVFGRSFCPECKTQLKWHDLAPILSFIYLRGQCRYCRKKISWQYPIVEILSGFIWVGVFYKVLDNFSSLNFFYYIFIFSALLIIAVYDFKWKIIPDKIVYPAIVVVLIYNFLKSLNPEIFKYQNIEISKYINLEIFKYFDIETFVSSLIVAIAAFLFFFSIFYFSKGRAMGLGDAKLAFLISLFLSPVLAAAAFTLAFVIGAVFGIILMGLGRILPHYKKWELKSQIAFGPFLILGAAFAFFLSDFIFKYLNF